MLPLLAACAVAGSPTETTAHPAPNDDGRFEEVEDFGDNPGHLHMYRYLPSPAPSGPAPLVVALHGCTQDASTFRNVGWESLADAHGFYVLYPEQPKRNNPLKCFRWFREAHLRRGEGENQSIKAMIDDMKRDFAIDDRRVFAMGHSAGGAQVAVMLATWPEVFAAGGIVAGVPYRCATTQKEAAECMHGGHDETPAQWGRLVRDAHPGYDGPYPKVSIWHGTNDTTAVPANSRQLAQQWTDVHGVDQEPDATDTVDGYPHEAHRDTTGTTVVERYEIRGQGHATFIDPERGCGAPVILKTPTSAVLHAWRSSSAWRKRPVEPVPARHPPG